MGLELQCPFVVTIIIGIALVGRGSCARDQHRRTDAVTPAPPALSTNGWRPMAPPADWAENAKLRDNRQENVGHPVLDKLQAHLEAAEKKRHEKYEVYAPAPPSILGSFSGFGHATVKAREPVKPKKKQKQGEPAEGTFHSSESRVVYTSHLVPPPFHQSQSNSVRFPEQYQRPDQLSEQQQQHNQFYLHPPVQQTQDTLLIPPPQTSDHVASYYFGGPQITSYQSQKFGDYNLGGSYLETQPFPQQVHHQYTGPVYNQQHSEIQHGANEQAFPSKSQQTHSFTTANIEFLPNREVPKSEENISQIPFSQSAINQNPLSNGPFNGEALELLKPSHLSYRHQGRQNFSAPLNVQTHSNGEPLSSGDDHKFNDETRDSLEITPSQTHTLKKNKNRGYLPLPDGEIINGQQLADVPQFQTASPTAELFIPSQQTPTDEQPSSVLGFSLGVSSDQQNSQPVSEQYFGNSAVFAQSPGERGRITRPYFKEEHQTTLAQDHNLGPPPKKHRRPPILNQRFPPDVTEIIDEHFIPTLAPSTQPFTSEPSDNNDAQDFNEVQPPHLIAQQVLPVSEEQISQPEQIEVQQTYSQEEEITPAPKPQKSRKPGRYRHRSTTTESYDEVTKPHESRRQNEERTKYRRPAANIDNGGRIKHRRPSADTEQEEDISNQSSLRTKHRRPTFNTGQVEEVSYQNEGRRKHRRPVPEDGQGEQVSYQNEVKTKYRRPSSELEQEQQVAPLNSHETQQVSPPRPRRPGSYKRPAPVEEESQEDQVSKYRRPQHHRRRPVNQHVQTDDVSVSYGDDVRQSYTRQPGTRTRNRPTSYTEQEYTSEDPGPSQSFQEYYVQEQYTSQRRRRPTPPPHFLEITADGSTSPPSAEDDIYSSQYGSATGEDETQDDSPVTQIPFATTSTPTTTTTTTERPIRGNIHKRQRVKDKYNRTQSSRSTTPLPETTPSSQEDESPEEFQRQDEDVPDTHNDIFEPALHQTTNFDLQKEVVVTEAPYEPEEYYTTFVIPTSTSSSTTTTTTTTSTTTESPLTTQATSASASTISKLRPRLRYGLNTTRPRFSLKDYRERVNRVPPPSLQQNEDDVYESKKTKVEEEGTSTTASPRVRYPTRTRGNYQYKKSDEDVAVTETTTTEPSRTKYRPKESRYGNNRYRTSSTTTTTTTTTSPPEVADNTERYKPGTSRYRPGTGKYYSRYRSTTELPAVTPEEDNGVSVSTTTVRLPVRPKGVFSAARRPYPLRPRPTTTKDTVDNQVESKIDSDESETSIHTQLVTEPNSSEPEVSNFGNYSPWSYISTETSIINNTDLPSKVAENDIVPVTMSEKVDSTVDPEEEAIENTHYVVRTTPPNDQPYTSEKTITTQHPEVETLSPSQRVADLTSSASLAGFFKSSASTLNTDARRITMATEDPILPIEAFFPVRSKNFR